MKESWRKFVGIILSAVVVVSFLIISINVLVDPYSVFCFNLLEHSGNANERFLKYERLKENMDEVNGLILGSSRAGLISPDSATDIRGVNYYNASFFGARPKEIHMLLLALERNYGYSPKEVVVGFDYYPFIEAKPMGLAFRSHPEVEGISVLEFWKDYIFASSLNDSAGKFMNHINNYIRLDSDKGNYYMPDAEIRIELDHQKYISQKITKLPSVSRFKANLNMEIFQDIINLRNFSDSRQIKAFFYNQPLSFWYQEWIDPDGLALYRNTLNSIFENSKYVDFSVSNDITHNPEVWYDLKHYRPFVGDGILSSMFEVISPSDTNQSSTEEISP